MSYFVDNDFEERFSKEKVGEIESEIESKHKKFSDDSPLYSLRKTSIHPIGRETSSMKIIYFVGDDFDKRLTLIKMRANFFRVKSGQNKPKEGPLNKKLGIFHRKI